MADKNTFPGPKYNSIIEPNSDRQIITVPLETVDFGARAVSRKTDVKNSMNLKHIKNET